MHLYVFNKIAIVQRVSGRDTCYRECKLCKYSTGSANDRSRYSAKAPGVCDVTTNFFSLFALLSTVASLSILFTNFH